MSDYIPNRYTTFSKRYPDIASSFEALGKACHEAGPLDDKTRRLIKLGIAISLRSEGAVHTQVRRALAAGASKEEISHAVLLSITTAGLPGTIAAMDWVEEVFNAAK